MSWWRKALAYSNPYAWQANWIYGQWAKGRERKHGVGPDFSSQYGHAVPVVYGRPRLTGAIVAYLRRISSSNFPARIILGEQGITEITYTWNETKRLTGGGGAFTLQDGTQTAGTISGDNPRNLAYKRSVVAGANSGPIPFDQIVPRLAFEVKGKFDATGHASGDADPAQVVVDMLTNTTYGLGWDASRVTVDEWGDDAVLATRQAASYDTWVNGGPLSLTLSRACTERKPLRDYLEEFLDATHSTVQWQFNTAGVATLYFVPRGDTAGGSFTPAGTVRYALTSADLIPNGDGELVEIQDEDGDTRADQDNTLVVSFLERFPTDPIGFHRSSTVEVEDPVSVSRDGLKRGPTIDLPCVTQRGPATALGKEFLKHSLYRGKPKMRVRVGWRFARLDPLDYVSITDDALGLSAYKVQVAAIEEDEDGVLTIDAVPAPLTLGNSIEHTTQSSDGNHEPKNEWKPVRRRATFNSTNGGTITFGGDGFSAMSIQGAGGGAPDRWRFSFDPEIADVTRADVRVEAMYEQNVGTGVQKGYSPIPVVWALTTAYVDIALLASSGSYVTLTNLGIGTGMNDYLLVRVGAYTD